METIEPLISSNNPDDLFPKYYAILRDPIKRTIIAKLSNSVPEDKIETVVQKLGNEFEKQDEFEKQTSDSISVAVKRSMISLNCVALAPHLSSESINPLFASVLRAIKSRPPISGMEELGAFGAVLARMLKESDAREFSRLVIEQLVGSQPTQEPEALAPIAAALGVQVVPDEVPELLSALLGRLFRNFFGSVSEQGKAATALISVLPSARAESVLKKVEEFVITSGGSSNKDLNQAIVRVADALVLRLSPNQAQAALVRVLDRQWHMRVSEARDELGQIAAVLSTRIKSDLRDNSLALARWELSTSGSDRESTAWALAIADLLPQDPEERYTEGFVEILKYPTAAGAVADALIERIRKRDATAPGAPAGIQANVAWIAKKFPSVDLATPPKRPEKPSWLTQ